MRSSYIENNYGAVLTAIVDAFKPDLCVELGVLDGYSACYIAIGIKDNGRGHLFAYDLFEDYAFKHGTIEDVDRALKSCGLRDLVNLTKMDAYKAHELHEDNSVDFLHVDISNNGDVIDKMMELWHPKIRVGGIICFEGGTQERDEIEWMIKYNKRPIKPAIENNPIIEKSYIFGTYLPFPGLTMLLKKRD